MKQNIHMLKPAGKPFTRFGQMLKTAFFFLLLILLKKESIAQAVQGRFMSYDFSAATGNITTWPVYFGNTTYIDTAAVTITEGAGLSGGAAAFNTAITAQGVNSTTEGAAVSSNDYFEITVKPKAGFEFRLDTLVLRWQFQTAATTMSFAIRSSRDNYRRTLATASQASGTAYSNQVTNLILTNSPLYASTTITIRIYVWGSGNQNRDFRITDGSATVNHDIDLRGRVATARPLIQAFDFSTSAGTQTSNRTFTCDTAFIDTAGVLITRGPGFTTSTAAAGSLSSSPANQTTLANAVTANSYIQFAIKPKLGFEYSLDRILIRYFWNTGSPTGYGLRSSRDGYTSNIATGTITGNGNFGTGLSSSYASQFIPLTTPVTSDSNVTYRLYIFGAAAAGNDIRFTDSTVNNTFNYDIAFYGTMTTSAIPKSTLSAPGSVTTCLGGGISLKTANVGGTAPFTIWLKDNLGNQRTHTQTQADSTFTIFPQSNRTYTLDSVKDVNGNKANSLAGTISVTVTNSPVMASKGTFARTLSHLDGYTLTYASGDSCKSWVKIQDSIGGTVLGSTTCTARVLDTLPINYTTRRFISRRVDITPTTNGIATVTLFYTQAEFNTFNLNTQYQVKMPTSSTDTVGVNSKLIIRRTRNSIDKDSLTSFTPSSVVWNQTNSQWEVSFRVNDGALTGNYYLSTPFNSTKMVSTITHSAAPTALGQTFATVTVDWNDVSGVTQYRLRVRPLNGNWNVSTVTGSQRTTTLAFNTTYEAQVRVYEGVVAQGEYTNSYIFTTPAEPGKLPDCLAPTNINVTMNSPVSSTISWTSATYATNYIVEMRALNSLVWGGTATAGNSVSFNSLTPGATYQYRIRTTCQASYTANGTSDYSAIGSFTMPSISPCGVVGNLTTVSTTTNSATVSWAPVTFATSYQVEMRLKNTAVWGGSSTSNTSFTFNNLSAGSNYEYRVRAYCNGTPAVTSTVIGLFSNVAEFTTVSAPVLGACLPPTNIVATPTANSVTVTWDSASNASGYFINIKQANAASWGGTVVSTLSRTFTSLSPATDYQVRIRTSCTPGATLSPNSVFSDTILFTTTALANKAVFATEETPSYKVYPNPTRDNLHVDFTSQSTEAVRIEVRDMTGRLIQTQGIEPMIGENTFDINLQSSADGLYLIRIYQGTTLQFMNKIQKTH